MFIGNVQGDGTENLVRSQKANMVWQTFSNKADSELYLLYN